MKMNLTLRLTTVVIFLGLAAPALAQEDGSGGSNNLRFFGVDLGVVNPVGSAELFYLPNWTQTSGGAPAPYSDYYNSSITTNFYAGISAEDGFEVSISFKITKVNYSNLSEGIIQSSVSDVTRSGVFSTYLLGSQLYLGQRMKPLSEGAESLYFGIAGDFSTLKHYSEQSTFAEDQTFSVSFIAGEEIPLFRDKETLQMFTFRIQAEFVAIASSERPRYIGLTFGVRQYFQ